MRSHLLFLILLVSNYSHSNTKISYFDIVNQAERYIINNEFPKASEAYELLFNLYTNNSYPDLHNACVCYIKQNKYENAFKLAEKLVQHGYLLEDFDQEAFRPLKDRLEWDEFVNEYFPKLRNSYFNTLDTNYRNKLFHAIRNDQTAALSLYSEYRDSIFYWQVDTLVILINQYGFPSCFNHKDTLSYKLNTVFRHYFGLKHRYENMSLKDTFYNNMNFNENNLEKYLLEAIQKGLLHPIHLLRSYNYSELGNKYGSISVKVYLEEEDLKFYQIAASDLIKINSVRINVGLPELTPDILNYLLVNTKKNFPFNEIKESYNNCYTCRNGRDYATLFLKIINDRRDSSFSSEFILRSIP